METINQILARELSREQTHIDNVIKLLDEGNTIPFIARYRKELHGSMDDQQIRRLADRLTYLRNLDARRSEIKQSIASQEKLTDELSSKLDSAATLAELEDLYRPYKPKRTTRASIAKEKGLMPLAAKLLMQEPAADPVKLAEKYVNPGKGVNTPDEALSGARDIIAERLSDSADIRRYIKELAHRSGTLTALKAADAPEDNGVYDMYFDFSEGLSTIPGYRVLAINRGEKEGILKPAVTLTGNEGAALVCRAALKPTAQVSAFVRARLDEFFVVRTVRAYAHDVVSIRYLSHYRRVVIDHDYFMFFSEQTFENCLSDLSAAHNDYFHNRRLTLILN